jgi:Cof subfamily protein (haloacid dehalogenase superfamily)
VTLFCSDIDGTLLGVERTLSDRTIRAIKMITDAGHTFVLCSSRMPASMEQLERLYGGSDSPLIAYNGGVVRTADRRVVLDVPIAPADARLIFEASRALNLHASFYSGDDWFAWADDRWAAREMSNTAVSPHPDSAAEYYGSDRISTTPPHKVMCMGDPDAIDEMEIRLAGISSLVTYRSKDTYLEIASASCSKGDGLRMVALQLGVDLDECYFFGDNYNDLPAFGVVGTSVAVANAKPAVLDAASVITASNHNDGVALFLEEWMEHAPRFGAGIS